MEDQPDLLGLFLCFKARTILSSLESYLHLSKIHAMLKTKNSQSGRLFSILNYSIDLHHDLCQVTNQTSFPHPLSFLNSDNRTYLPHGTAVDLHNPESAKHQQYKLESTEKNRLSLGTFQIKSDGANEKVKDQNNTLLAHKDMAKVINVIVISSSLPSV